MTGIGGAARSRGPDGLARAADVVLGAAPVLLRRVPRGRLARGHYYYYYYYCYYYCYYYYYYYYCCYYYYYYYYERALTKRELEYRIPRLHSPVNTRRFPEIFGDFCKNETIFLYVLVENRLLPFAPVDFRRKPEPVPRAQALSYLI